MSRAVRLILSVSIAAVAAAPPGAVADEKADTAVLAEAFRKCCAARAADGDETQMTVPGADGWLFLRAELRHLGLGPFWGDAAAKASKASNPEYADPLPAILDYKDQCEKLGIELILMPVPPKAVVYPEKICPTVKLGPDGRPPRLDAAHQAFYKLLADKGVRVLDLTDAFLAARAADKGRMYCMQDTHYSGLACILAAERVAAAVADRSWVKQVDRTAYATETSNVRITGDLLGGLSGKKPAKEELPLRFVGTRSSRGILPIEPDPASPVLLLGDSHALVFHLGMDMHAKGAGLADQLAATFGCPIEVVANRGAAVTPARINLYRKQKRTEGYLASKKLLLWCFAARSFTEARGGWRKIPITR